MKTIGVAERRSLLLSIALALGAGAAVAQSSFNADQYQCLTVPSQYNEVGSMFSVDSKGMAYRLGKVDGIQALPESEAGFPALDSELNIGAGLFVKFLEMLTKATGWQAQLHAAAAQTIKVHSRYEGVKLQVSEGQPEQAALDWFRAHRYRVSTGSRYFLVREAVRANAVDYKVQQSDMQKLGGVLAVRQVATGKLDVIDRDSDRSYVLKVKFTAPVNVCIKPQELVLLGSSANGRQRLEFRRLTRPIEISDLQP
jgi:hypothetical protein